MKTDRLPLSSLPSLLSLVSLLSLLAAAAPVEAFSLFPDFRGDNPANELSRAARWSAEPDPLGYETGLHDRIQAAVAHDFAEAFGRTSEEDRAVLRQIVAHAFDAWRTPDLQFDLDFDRVPVQGVDVEADHGFEIDVFAVPETHPVFEGGNFFGIAVTSRRLIDDRLLTNGNRNRGWVTVAADVYLNTDNILRFSELLPRERQITALTRLLMHEIGHALGMGHPNTTNAFYDLDDDPRNAMRIDGADPFAGLMYSPNQIDETIMSNERRLAAFVFYTELQNDDAGGRDVLYPSLTSCAADCDGNGEVDVAEILTALNVALGAADVDACYRADRDRDDLVFVDDLLAGIDVALNGCARVEPVVSAPVDAGTRVAGRQRVGGIACSLEDVP